jgi:hypothetical protein
MQNNRLARGHGGNISIGAAKMFRNWFLIGTLVLIFASLTSSPTRACESVDEYSLTGCVDLWSSAYIRLPSSTVTYFDAKTEKFFTANTDNVEFQRSELHMTLDQQPKAVSELLGFPVSWHLELRPWHDSTYDLPNNVGQGGPRHEFLADDLQTNLNGRMADDYDPLFREYYLDLRPKHFFIRLGRQIIAWGKSDGVYVLDILNNFNLVNPEIFDEQQVKIPVWAANINWQINSTYTLQGLFIPQYLPTYYAGVQIQHGYPIQGGYGDFTYNSTAYFNNILNGQFGFKIPSQTNLPSTRLNNWIYGARFSNGSAGDLHYTLNYLYTYTTTMIAYPGNTSTFVTATTAAWRPHRMQVAGGSFDYDWDTGNKWLDGTVFRAESAVNNGDVYYEGTVGNPVDVTHWQFMGGIDKTILGDELERPVFASFQYYQDWVVARNNRCACGPHSNEFQDLGFDGSNAGFRGVYKSVSTLYLEKTWLPGDFVGSSLAVVHDWQFDDWWVKPEVTYQFNDKTAFVLGFDIFAGSKSTPYGEFTNNSNVYFAIHRVLL